MRKISTRDRIIEAADNLFYQQGFEHTSFAQIAESVGISRGNFYYHFKTKDEILNAVIDYRLVKTHALLDIWEIEGKTSLDRIQSFINILIMNKDKIKQHGCPVDTLCSELVKLNPPRLKLNGLAINELMANKEGKGRAAASANISSELVIRPANWVYQAKNSSVKNIAF